MTRLSVNINKIALIRNSRGANYPDLLKVAADCEKWGAEGITVHPRPDERHIRYNDLLPLKSVVTTEFNIEGYPSDQFMEMLSRVRPDQCTLVPDAPDALTSDNGWDTVRHADFLKDILTQLNSWGIRSSLFLNPESNMLEGAAACGADRVEFYTGPYARQFSKDPDAAIKAYAQTALLANQLNIGINAGHDLNLDNLKYFKQRIPGLLEVSIGHALVCDALYFGMENTIGMYKMQLV